MSEQQQLVISHEATQSHEPMTDERVGELLSALGNHEGKAILMLAMRAGQGYGNGGLHALVEELPGAESVYIGRINNQFAYCRQSLQPIGMVTEIKPQSDGAVHYAASEDGVRHGKPLAATLLKLSDRYDVALSTIFGATASRGVRSPFVRYRLAQEFAKGNNLNVDVLTGATGFRRHVITRHLSSLALDGLVGFNQFEMERDEIAYELVSPPGKFTTRAHPDVLSAVDYLEKHATATLGELVENYLQTLSASEQQAMTISDVRNHLNVHLKSLEQRRGCIKKLKSKWSDEFTKVELSEDQKEFWQELVDKLEEFKTSGGGDPGARSEEILNDYGLIQRTLKRAYNQSPTANSGSLKDVGILALRAVKTAGKPVTINEVVRLVKETTGRQVDRMTVAHHFKELETAGRLASKPGKARLYSIQRRTT